MDPAVTIRKSLGAMALVAACFAAVYLGASVVMEVSGLLAFGAIVACVAVALAVAWRFAVGGRVDDARLLTSLCLCFGVASLVTLQPAFSIALALAPTVALAVALPMRSTARVRLVAVIALLAELPVVLAAFHGPPPVGMDSGLFEAVVTVQILVSFCFLVALALQARSHFDAQRRLAQRRSLQLDAVLSALAEVVLAVGEDDRVLLGNKAAERQLGSDLVGRTLTELLPTTEVDGVTMFQERPVEVLTRSACEGCRVVVVRDLGVERSLAELRADQAAMEAAAQLSQEHVLGVQRELRVPIRTIAALARSLEAGHEGPLGPRAGRAARDIAAAARRLESLSTTWLDLARAETGRIDVRPEATDLRQALEAALERGAAPQRGVRLVTDIVDACVAVDPRRLRQVAHQLLDYARRHCPDDGEIHLWAGVGGDDVVLQIAYDGTLTPEQEAGLFRTDPGLALARSLVELLGGRVEAEKASGVLLRATVPVGRRMQQAAAPADPQAILARTVESLAEVVEITDREGHFLFVNASFERTFGWSADEVLGRTPAEVLRSRVHSEVFWTDLWQTISSGSVWKGRLVSRTRQGELVPFDTVISPIRDDNDVVTHFVAVKRDISQRLELQAQLRQVERVAAGLAHQINNPLTVVLANLSFLQDVVGRDDRRLVGEIEDAAHRIRRVVGDLRRFSSTHREEALVDVRPLVEFALEMAAPVAVGRAALLSDLREVPMVLGDRSQLAQVFQHLVMNGLQAIPPGNEGQNHVQVSCFTDAGGDCVVEIRDTGEGVSEADRERVFQPFFTRRHGDHRGMGLAIGLGFVRGHGGDLEAVAVEGGGLFRVKLPAYGLARELTEGWTADPPALRVLVIDDEPHLLGVLEAALHEHHITCAATADEAEAVLSTLRFDVILCDLMMPGRTGMDLYEKLRDSSPGVAERFAFMTGADLVPEIERFLHENERALLRKPFNIGELRRFVRALATSRVSANGL